MKRTILAAQVACVWLAIHSPPALAQASALMANPQISVAYIQPRFNSLAANSNQYFKFTAIYEWLRVRQPLHAIQKFLAPLRLPQQLRLQVDQCGAERRPYKHGAPVTICYELIDKIEIVAANVKDNEPLKQTIIVGTFTQAVLHELAYAVFDILQVPVCGREEDAADRLAAFILLQFGEDVAHTTMLGTVEFFVYSGKTWTGSAFADAGSPEAQRFYNFLCIAYGGDHLSFGGWAESHDGHDPLLPASRADQCQREYEQVRNAFNLRIMPYVDPDLLLRVKATQWFLPGELGK